MAEFPRKKTIWLEDCDATTPFGAVREESPVRRKAAKRKSILVMFSEDMQGTRSVHVDLNWGSWSAMYVDES